MKRGRPVVLSKESLRLFRIVLSKITVGFGFGVFLCVNSIRWELKPDGILLNSVGGSSIVVRGSSSVVSGFEGL